MALEPVSQLEEEALKRKKRLEDLKRKAQAQGDGNKKLFRNYKPEASTSNSEKDEAGSSEASKTELIDLPVPMDSIEQEVKDQLDAMKTPLKVEEIDITNLAPRKIDWDLKRNIAKKLEILERRTQKAIAELIRDRLKKGQINIAEAVNVGTIDQGKKNTDDDEE